ncbi:hypothetical protein J6590_071055 [Homalodisca vitripennis]|nr:hypothetical protein J6590_071055 [Homalodisca vitripennis]
MSQLADSPLGAIVTHALITPDGKFIISSESGNILIWNRITGQVIFKEEQAGVRQLVFLEEGTKFLAISKPPVPVGQEAPSKTTATGIVRNIPSGSQIYSFEYPLKNITGISFKQAVVTCDGQNIVALAADKGHRETVVVFNAKTGTPGSKIPLKLAGIKELARTFVCMDELFPQLAVFE